MHTPISVQPETQKAETTQTDAYEDCYREAQAPGFRSGILSLLAFVGISGAKLFGLNCQLLSEGNDRRDLLLLWSLDCSIELRLSAFLGPAPPNGSFLQPKFRWRRFRIRPQETSVMNIFQHQTNGRFGTPYALVVTAKDNIPFPKFPRPFPNDEIGLELDLPGLKQPSVSIEPFVSCQSKVFLKVCRLVRLARSHLLIGI